MDRELIDIHTHILPGMDDGAQDLEQAVTMAALAAGEGMKNLVATPHVMRGVYENNRVLILKKVQELNLCLEVQRIKLKILPGAEYYFETDLPERLAAGQLLTLNDSGRYLLVEFPMTNVPFDAFDILRNLISQGITPVIAHPERNQQLVEYPGLMGNLMGLGVATQVTSHSILGLSGKKVQETALQFIEMGAVQIVASDAHSARTRSPALAAAFAEIEKRWGRELAQVLFCQNPWRVIRGRPIIPVTPQPPAEPKPGKNDPKAGRLKKLRLPWG